MGTGDPPDDDEAEQLIDTRIDFPESDRIVAVTVWRVPESDIYPEGVKYAVHYGTKTGDTILRYDNAHPEGRATSVTRQTERWRSTSPDGKYCSPAFGPK